MMTAVIFFGAIFGLTLFVHQRFMITWAGFLCGIIGGFVSIQQRIPTVSDNELELLTKSWFQILLIPIFGGIFSLVLYCIFLSVVVSGNLFPSFYTPKPPATGPDARFMIDIFTKTYPSTGEDVARFLFWSFVAEFSERFVLQIIIKTASSITEQKNAGDH